MPALKLSSKKLRRKKKGANEMKYDFDDFTTLQY
jgi:hypothetical protein